MKQQTAMQMHASATLNAGHGCANGHVQIEEQEIDDVAVEEAIGEVAHDAGEEQSERDIAPGVAARAVEEAA